MCNERDRLIAYIYDECDATERDAVRLHLDTCDECRVEVAALRSVREDLLAWDVPVHGSVWQPFAPPKPSVWWRQVPTWALATAASLVLLSGAAGGAIAHAFMVDPAQTPALSARDTRDTLTSADLAALEQRLNAQVSDRVGAVDARVQQVSTRSMPASFTDSETALRQEVIVLREANDRLSNLLGTFLANQGENDHKWEMKYGEVKGTLKNMQANMDSMASLVIK